MNKTIWTFWENYSENKNMEVIVNKCFKSWDKHCKDYKIIVLNNNNINKWIKNIPDNVYKYNIALQTDYYRLYLLYHYGGIWLDSSIFLTENIDFFIQNEKITLFKEKFNDKNYVYSTWFIVSLYPKDIFFKKCLKEIQYFLNNPINYEDTMEKDKNLYDIYIKWLKYIKDSQSNKDLQKFHKHYFLCYFIFFKIISKNNIESFCFYDSLKYGRYQKKWGKVNDMVSNMCVLEYSPENKITKFSCVERYKICEIIENKKYKKDSIVDIILRS